VLAVAISFNGQPALDWSWLMYVSFDIEVSKWSEDKDVLMPISCAAMAFDPPLADGRRSVVYGATAESFMSPTACRIFARSLLAHAMERTVITWNGAAFDFRILTAWAAKDTEDAVVWQGALENLTMEHIDPGFLMACQKGFMIGLDACAKAVGVQGKLEGMSGKYAPLLWSGLNGSEDAQALKAIADLGVLPGSTEARFLCFDYVRQDAIATVQAYAALKEKDFVQWITRRGRPARYPWVPEVYRDDEPLAGDLLTVRDSLLLPEADFSYLSSPIRREDCLAWIND